MNKAHNNLNIENLIKTEWFNQFDKGQQYQIIKGLENNVDISIYAKKEFYQGQMLEIRIGLEEKLDVSIYAKSEYSEYEMEQIRWGLESNIDVSKYAKPEYNWEQMSEIRKSLSPHPGELLIHVEINPMARKLFE